MEKKKRRPYGYWTRERIKEAAARFDIVSDFKAGESGAYIAACRMGIIDDLYPGRRMVRTTAKPNSHQQAKETQKFNRVANLLNCL